MTPQALNPAAGWAARAAAWGFHVPILGFALRTAFAGFAALVLAYLLGLEHPHWAAMSAWASSQPLREHLVSRGLYRTGGSVGGVVFAVALVLLAQGNLWVLALGLALWCAVCAWAGNLQRGYMVYGWMLAGYSASMVVLLQHGPVDSIWPFAADRMLTVITGVVVAVCVGWFFAPRRKSAVLVALHRQSLAQVLEAAAYRLRHAPVPDALDNARLLASLAEVEELLDLHAEGSRKARRAARDIHRQQHQAMELLYLMAQDSEPATNAAPRIPGRHALADALTALADVLRQPVQADGGDVAAIEPCLRRALHACEDSAQTDPAPAPATATATALHPGVGALYQLLKSLRRGLRSAQHDLASVAGATVPGERRSVQRLPALPLHRDATGAKQAAVRVGVTLLLLGVLWAATGWHLVAFGMLGLSVMLLVFSAFENPRRIMASVLRGQLIGAGLALLCQWLVWPLATSGLQMVLFTLPFAFVAGLLFAHKRTAAGGMDINMVMFILLAPTFPYANDMEHNLGMALAIVSGPAMAWWLYRWIYPTDGVQRLRNVAATLLAQVPALAAQLQDGSIQSQLALPADWQDQLHHRVLKLVRWGAKTQHAQVAQFPVLWQALRGTQSTMLALQAWRHNMVGVTPALRRTERCAELALRRLAAQGPDAATLRAWRHLAAQGAAVWPAPLAGHVQAVAAQHLPTLAATAQALQITFPTAK